MLYNLRKVDFKRKQLYRLYCCYLRTFIEYCTAVYHALLNRGQEETPEKLHRHAIRICYRFDGDKKEVMAENNIETLRNKRVRRCNVFIRKAFAIPVFSLRWFKPRPECG